MLVICYLLQNRSGKHLGRRNLFLQTDRNPLRNPANNCLDRALLIDNDGMHVSKKNFGFIWSPDLVYSMTLDCAY